LLWATDFELHLKGNLLTTYPAVYAAFNFPQPHAEKIVFSTQSSLRISLDWMSLWVGRPRGSATGFTLLARSELSRDNVVLSTQRLDEHLVLSTEEPEWPWVHEIDSRMGVLGDAREDNYVSLDGFAINHGADFDDEGFLTFCDVDMARTFLFRVPDNRVPAWSARRANAVRGGVVGNMNQIGGQQ